MHTSLLQPPAIFIIVCNFANIAPSIILSIKQVKFPALLCGTGAGTGYPVHPYAEDTLVRAQSASLSRRSARVGFSSTDGG